jgi:putative membrane protein
MRPIPRAACIAVVAALACHRASSSAVPAAQQLTDGNIVAIVLAANNTDLNYARLVPARTRAPEVKAFADRMTTDHTLLSARVSEIALRHDISARDNAVSLGFRDHSAARRDVLRELHGATFDSVYVANEIEYHQELLAAIDAALVPNARTPELREFVISLKPPVAAHLAHAEQMRATIATRK